MSITELYDYIHNPECDPVELYCKLFTVYDKAKSSYDELIEKDGYKGTLMHLSLKEKNIPLIEWLIWNNLCLEYIYILLFININSVKDSDGKTCNEVANDLKDERIINIFTTHV